MDADISSEMAFPVYSLMYLLEFVISLSNASLEAIVKIGFLIFVVGMVIELISSRLGENIREGGEYVIVGGISGYATGVIVQAFFPLVPSPLNWIIFLVPLVPLILSIKSIVQ